MTGESSFSEHCLQYYRWLISGALLTVGNFLLWEHFIRFGGFDLELLGHEYYGLALILLGFLIAIKWNQLSGLMKAIRERNSKAMLDEGEKKMSCDFPIKCRFWDSKERKCKLSPEEFQELCEKGQNPCEAHQEKIDAKAEQEFMEAYYRGDEEMMEAIISSPFTNFGKNMGRRNEINTSF